MAINLESGLSASQSIALSTHEPNIFYRLAIMSNSPASLHKDVNINVDGSVIGGF